MENFNYYLSVGIHYNKLLHISLWFFSRYNPNILTLTKSKMFLFSLNFWCSLRDKLWIKILSNSLHFIRSFIQNALSEIQMDEWLWVLFLIIRNGHSSPKTSPVVIFMMMIIRIVSSEHRWHTRYSSKDLTHTTSIQSLQQHYYRATITSILNMMPRGDKQFAQHPTSNKEVEWW